MKVTDEMVEAAVRTWRAYDQEYPGSGNWQAMHDAIEAALAAAPQAKQSRSSEPDLDAPQGDNYG